MNKNIVITGANRGIGLALAKQYASVGENVYAICRTRSEALDLITDIQVIDSIDVTNGHDLGRLTHAMKGVNIDVLINNAGILSEEALGNIDVERLKKQFEVNAIGSLMTTEALLNNLQAGGKIILISSRMGSISDNGSGGSYGYRMSKAALNSAGKSLAIDLKPRHIALGILHPGFVQTALVDHQGELTADQSASQLIERIEELTLKTSGTFRHTNGESLPW